MRIASSLVALGFLTFTAGSPFTATPSVVSKAGQTTSISSFQPRFSGSSGILNSSIPHSIPASGHSNLSGTPSGFSARPTSSNVNSTQASATPPASFQSHKQSLGLSGSPAPTAGNYSRTGNFSHNRTSTNQA